MPISRAFALVALLGLAACEGGFGAGAPQSAAVAQGAVIVAGPAGYCVDRRLTREGPEESFVVLGACSAFARGGAAPSGGAAVLTATVANAPGPDLPPPAELEQFFRSERGRQALSRSGQAGTVQVLQGQIENGVLLLYIRDTSRPEAGPSTDSAYWRAVVTLNGRLVTATVRAFANRPISTDRGFRTLGEFVTRLRAANAGPTT